MTSGAVTLAGAFVLGALAGAAAVLRVLVAVLRVLGVTRAGAIGADATTRAARRLASRVPVEPGGTPRGQRSDPSGADPGALR